MPEIESHSAVTETIDLSDLKHVDASHADEALKIIQGSEVSAPIPLDPESEKRLLRKIDYHILPFMCLVNALNFLDKTALSYGAIMGLTTDLHLHGTEYSWVAS